MDNKTLTTLVVLVMIFLVAGFVAGYSLKAAAEKGDQAPVVPDHEAHFHVYDMSSNGMTVNVTKGTEFMITLPENGGSTGYLWNITSTQGLDVLGSWFVPGEKGLTGEPGERQWMIRASRSGEQKFKATLLRPFEEPAGNGTVYQLIINVV